MTTETQTRNWTETTKRTSKHTELAQHFLNELIEIINAMETALQLILKSGKYSDFEREYFIERHPLKYEDEALYVKTTLEGIVAGTITVVSLNF